MAYNLLEMLEEHGKKLDSSLLGKAFMLATLKAHRKNLDWKRLFNEYLSKIDEKTSASYFQEELKRQKISQAIASTKTYFAETSCTQLQRSLYYLCATNFQGYSVIGEQIKKATEKKNSDFEKNLSEIIIEDNKPLILYKF